MRSIAERAVERLGINRIAGVADDAAARVGHVERGFADLGHLHKAYDERLDAVDRQLSGPTAPARIFAYMQWATHAPLRREPQIDVVMPTRNRARLVTEAIDSVRRQTYQRWRLIVVDDGSTDETSEVLATLYRDEPRLEVLRTEGSGAAAARNRGLAETSGDWVAFCDDDNVMHPGWLRTVAEYVGRERSAAAVFGAQLREDVHGGDQVPWVLFTPEVTLDELRRDNTIDMNVLAVRRNHPELHFDETFDLYIDWEMVERVMTATPLHPISAYASLYTLRAPTRITDRHDDDSLERMRRFLADRTE